MWCTHLTYYDNFPGCFVAGLEYSADVTAEVIGKPEKAKKLRRSDYFSSFHQAKTFIF